MNRFQHPVGAEVNGRKQANIQIAGVHQPLLCTLRFNDVTI